VVSSVQNNIATNAATHRRFLLGVKSAYQSMSASAAAFPASGHRCPFPCRLSRAGLPV
jgi:hypothetical protein